MTYASIPAEQREALGIHYNVVSVSIEDTDDLIHDLEHGLSHCEAGLISERRAIVRDLSSLI